MRPGCWCTWSKPGNLGGFRVWLRFNDGLQGDVDLAEDLWGEVFEPLRERSYFAGFVVNDTLTWPNGADFAPEFLHQRVSLTSPRAASTNR